MSITVGKSVARVDAFDKVTGRTKYYEDRMPAGALYIRIKHAEIAHGFVKSVDTAAAEAIDVGGRFAAFLPETDPGAMDEPEWAADSVQELIDFIDSYEK